MWLMNLFYSLYKHSFIFSYGSQTALTHQSRDAALIESHCCLVPFHGLFHPSQQNQLVAHLCGQLRVARGLCKRPLHHPVSVLKNLLCSSTLQRDQIFTTLHLPAASRFLSYRNFSQNALFPIKWTRHLKHFNYCLYLWTCQMSEGHCIVNCFMSCSMSFLLRCPSNIIIGVNHIISSLLYHKRVAKASWCVIQRILTFKWKLILSGDDFNL